MVNIGILNEAEISIPTRQADFEYNGTYTNFSNHDISVIYFTVGSWVCFLRSDWISQPRHK